MSQSMMKKLRKIVVRGDRKQLCKVVAPLSDSERQELVKDVLKLASTVNTCWGPDGSESSDQELDQDASSLLVEFESQDYADWRIPRWTVNLLVAAICERKVLTNPHKYSLNWLRSDLQEMQQRLLQILLARQPKWLAGWIQTECKDEDRVVSSLVERGLIREGLISCKHDSAYFFRISSHPGLDDDEDAVETDSSIIPVSDLKELIEADPGLLNEDIWGFFNFDSEVFRYGFDLWGGALVELSCEGKIDRNRLLESSLSGMALPLSPTTLNGMGKFHQLLEPTIEERESLLDHYLGLLGAHESTVVGHSLKALGELLKAKRLDGRAYISALSGVFNVEKKTQPALALKILKKLLKQFPDLEPIAAKELLGGLTHPNLDIQESVIQILASLKSGIPQRVSSRLAELTDEVAPSLQAQLRALSSMEESSISGAKKSKGSAKSLPDSAVTKSLDGKMENQINQLRTRADSLDIEIQQKAGIIDALTRLDSNLLPAIDVIEKANVPRRNQQLRIEPIGSLDELIQLVSKTIEGFEDAMQLERILDGISRFHAERPDDFDLKVSAFKQRIEKLNTRHSGTFVDTAASIGFTQLLMTWLEMPELEFERSGDWWEMRGWFLRERIDALRSRIVMSRGNPYSSHEIPMPLLALPSYENGWVDPIDLVNRLNDHYVAHSDLFDEHDLAQAIV